MINQLVPADVLEAFTEYTPGLPKHTAGKISIEPLGGGLINHSYKICSELKPDFFLQKINTNVFPQPAWLQDNYMELWQYAEFEFTGQRMPNPIYWKQDATLYIDEQGNYWRAFEYIENSTSYAIAATPARAKAVALAFARFTAAFDDMNTDLLKPVITNFHNLSFRYRQFREALQKELYERKAKSIQLVNELKQRERYVHFYELMTASSEFPQRVMHHDAKIANVLFHQQTGEVICPVDFDTVMPGYFISDLGDMIRSMAGKEENDGTDNRLKTDYYDTIVESYVTAMNNSLTATEKSHIHYAGLLMIYMQCLRFLTDYLNGDVYYQVSYPEQNLDRALNQFSLLQSLEAYLESKN